MTNGERRAVELLAEAWNAILGCVHDSQSQREACASIHSLQHLVMAQATIRSDPHFFRAPTDGAK